MRFLLTSRSNDVINTRRVDKGRVVELEDLVRKNSEYQKLLQNKIKEMQNTEKKNEATAACKEQELGERVRKLEEQLKDQVSSPICLTMGHVSRLCSFIRRISTV